MAASERLYEHIDDIPFSSEFKSIVIACLETANVVLTRFQAGRHEGDAEVGPDTEALLEAWQSPAAADRAVRTTTWLILGGAMAQHSPDRQQEAIDAASAAMPLSPLDLAQVRDHFDECSAWVRNSDVENEVARLVAGEQVEPDHLFDPWGVAVTLNSFDWLMLSVLQRPRPDDEAKLDDDSASWGMELMEGMFSVFNDMCVSPDGDATRGGRSDEAEEKVDIDQLLEYWRKHRHEYLDPEE